MFRYTLIFYLFLIWGCGGEISKNDLHKLNGYWEIAAVKFPNGETKSYATNPTIDYIFVENQKGYRKKVQPQLDGTFDTSKDSESFTLIEQNGGFHFLYKTALSEWKEELIQLDADSFSVINSENVTYTYHRHQPINVFE